jgi:hypothetical protein
MRLPIFLAAAAMLTGPALARTSPSNAPAERGSPDRECRAGDARACADGASAARGSAAASRRGSGAEAVPQVNDASGRRHRAALLRRGGRHARAVAVSALNASDAAVSREPTPEGFT